MEGYVTLPTYNANLGVLGISQNVFKYLATQSIKTFKEIYKTKDANQVFVYISRNNVVTYKISILVKSGTNKTTLKQELIDEIQQRIETIADSIPTQYNIRINEK
jgi:hypothetical protein